MFTLAMLSEGVILCIRSTTNPTMDNESDSGSVILDSLGWSRELQLFSSANIILVQNQGVYEVTDADDLNSKTGSIR